MVSQHLFDLGNCPGGVEMFWARFCAVHNRVTLEHGISIIHLFKSLSSVVISRVNEPSVRLLDDGRSEIFVSVPPVRWTRGGAASAEDALVETVELCSVSFALVVFSCSWSFVSLLEPWLDRFVLSVEVVHVWDEILDDIHVGKWPDLSRLSNISAVRKTSQVVDTIDVHGAGSADTFSARSSESKSRVDLVLDHDKSIKNHWAAFVHVDFVGLHSGLSAIIGVPSVNLELLLALVDWNWVRKSGSLESNRELLALRRHLAQHFFFC